MAFLKASLFFFLIAAHAVQIQAITEESCDAQSEKSSLLQTKVSHSLLSDRQVLQAPPGSDTEIDDPKQLPCLQNCPRDANKRIIEPNCSEYLKTYISEGGCAFGCQQEIKDRFAADLCRKGDDERDPNKVHEIDDPEQSPISGPPISGPPISGPPISGPIDDVAPVCAQQCLKLFGNAPSCEEFNTAFAPGGCAADCGDAVMLHYLPMFCLREAPISGPPISGPPDEIDGPRGPEHDDKPHTCLMDCPIENHKLIEPTCYEFNSDVYLGGCLTDCPEDAVAQMKEHVCGVLDQATTTTTPSPIPTTEANTVSCGNHCATSCADCPQGHGAHWCNGECEWDAGSCRIPPKSDPTVPKMKACIVIRNAAISGHNVEHLTSQTIQSCTAFCHAKDWCKSFDWHKNSNACDLSDKCAPDVGGLKSDYAGSPYDHYSCACQATTVSCGNHDATSCADCPQGHGAGWCNGECEWVAGLCQAGY